MASRRPGRKTACAASTAPRKRRRPSACLPESPESPPPSPWVFPVDIVLEIVARTDASTLIRCAALCKSLRRDILSPAFLGRDKPADSIVPPCLLGYLHTYDEENKEKLQPPPSLFSLVHPSAVPAAVSFSDKHLAPFLSRSATDLLGRYKSVTSRGGLVVLRRRNINRRKKSERPSDMCVYNPMTGERTFFSSPPDIGKHFLFSRKMGKYYRYQPNDEIYVLLTAADGINCSFMLLAADFSGFYDCSCSISAQTISSDSGGTWAPATNVGDIVNPWVFLEPRRRPAVVLHGGVIYWLANCNKILTYEVSTLTPGSVKLPVTKCDIGQLHLGKSPDGRLRLLVADDLAVSVWLLSSGNVWELKTMIHCREDQLRLLDPEIPPYDVYIEFRCSGERTSSALLSVDGRPYRRGAPLIVLDVETGNMRRLEDTYSRDSLLVEVDLPTRLQAMKTF